jgi:hypothetical protein
MILVYGTFLIATESAYLYLLVVLVGCSVFGFYLNYDIRRLVSFLSNGRLEPFRITIVGHFIKYICRSKGICTLTQISEREVIP